MFGLLSKRNLIVAVPILIGAFVYLYLNKGAPQSTNQIPAPAIPSSQTLRIESTNPDPLEGAVILPTQTIEFNLNKEVVLSEFKHKFDPELKNGEDYEIEVVGDQITKRGKSFKIHFKKPLELGLGYTLFILANTHSTDDTKIDKEYSYHFQTIRYKGI